MSKDILVTGETGLVGSKFVASAKNRLNLIYPNKNEFNPLNRKKSEKFFDKNNNINVVINFIAHTNVDEAEKQRFSEGVNGSAWQTNVEIPKNLVEICKERDIFFIQISTDFVFPGTKDKPGPYTENDVTPTSMNKTGWYGWTKNVAEGEVRKWERSAIVRIAYPFYSTEYKGKLDFAKGFLKLFDENKLYPVFTNQTISVLNVDDFIDPMIKIIDNEIEGIFHIVSNDTTTPFEFAEYLLLKTRGVKDVVKRGQIEDFVEKMQKENKVVALRPKFGGLKTEETEKRLGFKFETWKEMVDKFADDLN